MQNKFLTAALLLGLGLVSRQLIAANGPVDVPGTNFVINVVDPLPVLGFSDPTPAAPVGGNPGTTIGDQRLEAYKRAAEIWQETLAIDVRIVLQATFVPLTCEADAGVLGAAGALTVFRDFDGPSFPSTWYGAALANELAGEDLEGTDPDPALLAEPFNDEIVSFFNSELGKAGCLENSGWYYGLDNDNPPGTIDFLTVLLHEVGHGLGFQNFADDVTGENFLGYPDQWSRFQRDNLLGKHWDQMLNLERSFSAVNGPNLVWAGPAVTAAAPSVLGPALVVLVNAPAAVAGTELPFGTASFGPAVQPGGLTADIELANDGVGVTSDACEQITNDLTGKIALIDRGSCTFVSKAQNAEAAGAIGVIIANNVGGATPPGLGGSGAVGIPTVSVTLGGGQLLRQNAGTNVTIGAFASDGSLAGVSPEGFVELYAPNPAEPGSSVAHFNVTASPNLLMEPAINDDLAPTGAGGVDLTDELLNDIGWNGNVSCAVDADSRATVTLLDFCPTGVPNYQGTFTVLPSKAWLPAAQGGSVAGGCYVQDVVNACTPLLDANGGGGQYQTCIVQVTNGLRKQGHISRAEADAITDCSELITPLLNP